MSCHVRRVDAKGLAPDGTKADVPADPEFLPQVFKAEVGEEGDPFQTKSGNVYVIRVDGVTPPKLKPLDQVRAEADRRMDRRAARKSCSRRRPRRWPRKRRKDRA